MYFYWNVCDTQTHILTKPKMCYSPSFDENFRSIGPGMLDFLIKKSNKEILLLRIRYFAKLFLYLYIYLASLMFLILTQNPFIR